MERQFTEQEVSQVIRRAAELQERLTPEANVVRHGIGASELVRIATELGLEERLIRQAISDPKTFVVATKGKVTSMNRTLERTAAGLPDSEAFEIVLDEFGPSGGVQSGPSTVGDTMTYQSMAGMTHSDILVSKKGGSTRIKVGANTFLPLIAIGLPAGMATLITAVNLGRYGSVAGIPGATAGILAAVIGVVGIWGALRWINKWSNEKVEECLDRVVERINSAAATSVGEK